MTAQTGVIAPPSPRRRRASAVRTLAATVALTLLVAACGDGDGAAGDRTDDDEDARRGFTVAAAGDILLHMPVMDSARTADGSFDFDPLFDGVREVISAADLAICHQETPLARSDAEISGHPLFNAAPAIAPALKAAGFDACEATSNHSIDQGFDGVVATLDALDAAGLDHTGTGRTAEEQAEAAIYDVEGVAVGHLAYTYGYNDNLRPAEAPWLSDLVFPEVGADRVLADAAALRDRGAEFTIVSIQWGAEYQQTPTAEQRKWARLLLGSPDVDLVLGDHVHVIQPCQRMGGKYVHYGMGNLLSNQSPDVGLLPSTKDGAVVTYEVEERAPGAFEVTSMTFTPTVVTQPGHRIELATPRRHARSYERTVAAMTALGPEACDAEPTS